MKVVRCGGCASVVQGADEACQALGQIFHTTCFVCSSCGRTLRGMAFYNINSRVYCEEDYKSSGLQDEAIRCHSCDHVIKDSILEAQGNYYHPGCFKCSQCSVWLDKIPFTVGKDGKTYCLKDYHKLFSPVCWRCKEQIWPVEGCDETVKVTSMDKDFHVDCFCCEICGIQLTDEPEKRCYPLDEHLLCHKCHLNWITSGDTPKEGLSLAPSRGMSRTTNKSGRRMSSELVLEQVKRNSGVFTDHFTLLNSTSDQNMASNADLTRSKSSVHDINSTRSDSQCKKNTAKQSNDLDCEGTSTNSTSSNIYEQQNTGINKSINSDYRLASHRPYNTTRTLQGMEQSGSSVGQQNGGLATSPSSNQRRRVRITENVTCMTSGGSGLINTSSLPRVSHIDTSSLPRPGRQTSERSSRIGQPTSYITSSLDRRKDGGQMSAWKQRIADNSDV